MLLDSGNDEDAGRKLLRTLEAEGLKLSSSSTRIPTRTTAGATPFCRPGRGAG